VDADVVRELIRRRLEDGRLPRGRMAEVRLQLGDGRLCDGCGAVIATKQTVMLGLDVEDWSEIRFHDECFQIWDEERLKDPQLGRAGSTPAKKDRVA
jgi:hypothetical protein